MREIPLFGDLPHTLLVKNRIRSETFFDGLKFFNEFSVYIILDPKGETSAEDGRIFTENTDTATKVVNEQVGSTWIKFF